MLKHEFETLATNGEPIDADLFEQIHADYMNTPETKQQYVSRVFGAGNTPETVKWKFTRHIEQQRTQAGRNAALYELTQVSALLSVYLAPGTLSDGTCYAELQHDNEHLRYVISVAAMRLKNSAAMLEREVATCKS